MTASESVRKIRLRPISTRVEDVHHEAMARLAEANGRGVGEEYRAATAAWLARPSNAALLVTEPEKAAA